MKSYNILVDDVRDFPVDLIARNYQSAIRLLAHFSGDIGTLFLDHDLGEEKSGYDVLMFMINNELTLPNEVVLVTANPVGRKNLSDALIHDCGYIKKLGTTFIKDTQNG